MPGRTDSLQESGRATAPPSTSTGCENLPRYPGTTQYIPFPQSSTEPSTSTPRYTPNYSDLNFFSKLKPEEKSQGDVGAHSLGKNKSDPVTDTLLSFLQKKSEGECSAIKDSGGKRRRKENAMSHYPDDAKRLPGYDYHQWDYRSEGASARRGHIPFCGTPQGHGWGPMAMGGPYFPNPHMVPAHAHSAPDYRFNQWTPPTKLQHAHSQPKIPAPIKPVEPPLLDPLTDLQALVSSREQHESVDLRLPTHGGLKTEKPVQLTVHRLDSADKEITSTNEAPDLNYTQPLEDPKSEPSSEESNSPKIGTNGLSRPTTSNGVRQISETTSDINASLIPATERIKTPIPSLHIPCTETIKTPACQVPTSLIPGSETIKTPACQVPIAPLAQTFGVPLPHTKSPNGSVQITQSATSNSHDPKPTESQDSVMKSKEGEKSSGVAEASGSEKFKDEVEDVVEETPKSPIKDIEPEVASQPEIKVVDDTAQASDVTQSELRDLSESVTHSDLTMTTPSVTPSEPSTVTESPDEKPEVNESVGILTANPAESLPTVSSTSTDVKMTKESSKKKKPARKRSRFPAAKLEAKKPKVVKPPKPVVERKGPVLHIKGSKEAPVTVAVLNGPRNDEDESGGARVRATLPRDFRRGRGRHGLFSSTLSARYDARTADPTWICVFCKLGPHRLGLGDLFGPYVVIRDPPSEICEYSGDEKDIVDAQRRGGRNKKSIRANNFLDYFQMSRKLKRTKSVDAAQAMSGLTPVSDDESDSPRYEVWVHEACAVWSPGICMIDTRLLGLQEAVWHCQKATCSQCGLGGANLGCIHRNCPNRAHYVCAKQVGWSLPDDTFIPTCQFHVQRS